MKPAPFGVSFDLFGTLVAVDRPDDPGEAIAGELRRRGIAVPEDWPAAYREVHIDRPVGREGPLAEHVTAALQSRGVAVEEASIRRAVRDAFEGTASAREGAREAITAAARRGPVGVLSNCSVEGLVGETLARSSVPTDRLDAVVTSVGCGWRKPHARAFEAVAAELGVEPSRLVHVGDDPDTDGGVTAVNGTFVSLDEQPLASLPSALEGQSWA